MSTNEQLRQRAKALIQQGVNQKVLASRMKIDPGTFSKWLHGKVQYEPRVGAVDGLEAYAKELAAVALGTQETQRSAAAAAETIPATGTTGAAGSPFRRPDRRHVNSGPPPGVPERRRPPTG